MDTFANARISAGGSTQLEEILASLDDTRQRIAALADGSKTRSTQSASLHLVELQEEQVRISKDYFPAVDQKDINYQAIALAGEVGEALNVLKKYNRTDISWDEFREHMKSELPDILIYLVLLADACDIWLGLAYIDKKEYNDSRFGTTAATE